MSDDYIPPEECLRRSAEAFEKAAEQHEDGEIEARNNSIEKGLSWLEEGKFEGDFEPMFAEDDLAARLVDLTPEEVEEVRELYDEGTYSYKDLAQNFRCSIAAIQTVIEYPPRPENGW